MEKLMKVNAGSGIQPGLTGASRRVAQSPGAHHPKPAIDRKSELFKACLDFESVFIKQMLNVMRKTVEKSDLLHGGFAEDVFEDMLYDEYSRSMAENASFGLSDMLYRQLSPLK